ncbi:hypothetical protein [Halorubrum sp. DTA98]|uniref:hypothetical protein n=1 Tax=Halorubrum sp. DTA98 TaxID=3402163 RepID=UPI003AAFF896
MRRRTVLATSGTVVLPIGGSVAGCLGVDNDADTDGTGDDADTDGTGDDADTDGIGDDENDADGDEGDDEFPAPSEFEACGRLIVRYDELPAPAREEVDAAVDGGYETDEEAYLPNMLDPESYVRVDGTEYAIDVTREGETTRIVAEETIPTRGLSSFRVANRTDDPVEVSVVVVRVRDDETVLDADAELEPDESETLDPFERQFGRYEATVATEDLEETVSWSEEEMSMPFEGVEIRSEEVVEFPRAVLEPIDCRGVWGLG